MLISHAHFPILSTPTHHHLHARGVFISFFFIITLNLTTITLRPVKRENQLNSHFLLHRLPFYASFFSLVVYSSSCWLAGLLDGWLVVRLHHFLSRCVYIWLSHSHSHHSFRFINLQPFAAFDGIKVKKERKETHEEKETGYKSQGCNKTSIVVQSFHCYRLMDWWKLGFKILIIFHMINKSFLFLFLAGKQNWTNAVLLP